MCIRDSPRPKEQGPIVNHHRINRLWQSATLFLAPLLLVLLIWLRPSMGMYQWLLWLCLLYTSRCV